MEHQHHEENMHEPGPKSNSVHAHHEMNPPMGHARHDHHAMMILKKDFM